MRSTITKNQHVVVVQSLTCAQAFVMPWTAVQASPSFTVSQSLLKLMSLEWVMSFQPSHTQLLWDTAYIITTRGLLGGTVLKNLPANAGDARDAGLIPELGRLPGEGNDHPLQYPRLENSMDRGAWQATVQWVTESQTWLSDCIQNYYSRKKIEYFGS